MDEAELKAIKIGSLPAASSVNQNDLFVLEQNGDAKKLTGDKLLELSKGADGKDGAPGADGVSPTVEVSSIDGGHTVTITDADGTKRFDVLDGAIGPVGKDGEPGQPGEPGKDATINGKNVLTTDNTLVLSGENELGVSVPTKRATKEEFLEMSDEEKKGLVVVTDDESGMISRRNFISGENILDNWYFVNPINQRKVSGTIKNIGYFIDRWSLVSGTVEMRPNGILLDGEIQQALEFPIGLKTSASVLTTSGEATATYDESTKIFSIKANNITIVAAKLEVGTYQTLYDEDANLLDGPPNYSQELAKCQRYFFRGYASSNYAPICMLYFYTEKRAQGAFFFPAPMARIPSFRYSGRFSVYYTNGSSVSVSEIKFSNPSLSLYTALLEVVPTSSFKEISVGCLEAMDTSTYIEFDADIPIPAI